MKRQAKYIIGGLLVLGGLVGVIAGMRKNAAEAPPPPPPPAPPPKASAPAPKPAAKQQSPQFASDAAAAKAQQDLLDWANENQPGLS